MSHLPIGALLQNEKYRICRFIGSGGFGCTYEAEHVMLEKRVAIKEFFVRDFCNRDEATSRVTLGTESKRALVDKLRRKFIDEAKNLCRLRHPGIVSVSDVFEENGTAYFVMDFIQGESLAELVQRKGALPEAQAVALIRRAADALQYVHAHNRLHLDIKPGNIMVDRSGEVVLIDFGASKQYDEEGGENTSTLLGKTPGYAPLEQMGNDVVQFLPATDIYALGATLYKLLTGNTPLSATLLASGEELDDLPATINKAARRAIEAAMTINKRRRPQSVAEFLALLDASPAPSVPHEETIVEEPVVEVTIFDEEPAPTPRQRYQVGDYYDDGIKQGVVFYVDESGQHGKIVHLKQAKERVEWATEKNYGSFFSPDRASNKLIGAGSESDGLYNMQKIQRISNWESRYPAFAWCSDDIGEWYLPAIEELKLLTINSSIREVVNQTLKSKDADLLPNLGESTIYWSSTETVGNLASCIFMLDGNCYNDLKAYPRHVRAIATF